MRTKTLLIAAAAALAAGIISSKAQVYSQNVVGYINQVVPAGRFQIIGSSLINGSDAANTNMDPNVLVGNGCYSANADPGTSTNTTMLYWTGLSFKTYYYYNAADAGNYWGSGNPAGWYTPSGDLLTGLFTNGTSAFIHNTASAPLTNTIVGTVFQNTNVVYTIKPGLNLISLAVPVATNSVVVDVNGNQLPYGLPQNLLTSQNGDPDATLQDTMLYWSGLSYKTLYYYNNSDANSYWGSGNVAGFYTPAGDNTTVPSVNQGFFIKHIGSAISWTNTFSVQ